MKLPSTYTDYHYTHYTHLQASIIYKNTHTFPICITSWKRLFTFTITKQSNHFILWQFCHTSAQADQIPVPHMTVTLPTSDWTKQDNTSTGAFKSNLRHRRLHIWLKDLIFDNKSSHIALSGRSIFAHHVNTVPEVQNSLFSLILASHDNTMSKTKNITKQG